MSRLPVMAVKAKARPVGARLFAALTAVALWSWPHDAGALLICVPVEVTW
jgi:hypothetical protein